MGNYISCCYVEPQIAKLIDHHGNLRQVKVPITAAEIMLEEPGYVVSPVDEIRRSRRIPAMKADEELLAGKIYLLVPACRANYNVSELEMALVDSACKKRRVKRHSSRVSPALMEGSIEKGEGPVTGFPGYRLGNYRQQWKPVLETISEGI